jgi:hypothetical protein
MKTTARTTVALLGLAMLAFAVHGRAQPATVAGGTHVPNNPPGPQFQDLAEVTFTVTDFNDVCAPALPKGDGLTRATMELTSDKSGRVQKVNETTLRVEAPGATFKFTIVPDHGAETYFPIGIALVRVDPPAATVDERLGLQVFHRLQSPNAQVLFVDDHFAHTARRMSMRYKFCLVIQRGSDGKLGIIDPGIINES